MKTEHFQSLIQAITGRPFEIHIRTSWRDSRKADSELMPETRYFVCYTLPLTGICVGFDWDSPKSDEKFLRSFITAFSKKYLEPSPAAYDDTSLGGKKWEDRTPKERESAFLHHRSNMLSREQLLEIVEKNFESPQIETALIKYGFYETEYGVGIFCYFQTRHVLSAMDKMRKFLDKKNIAAREEFSDARWVYRFRIETQKAIHLALLKEFSAIN